MIEVAKYLTGHENIASKRWVYEQYDSMVGTVNMSTNISTDAGIVNLKETDKALAMTVDCNARMVNAKIRNKVVLHGSSLTCSPKYCLFWW